MTYAHMLFVMCSFAAHCVNKEGLIMMQQIQQLKHLLQALL